MSTLLVILLCASVLQGAFCSGGGDANIRYNDGIIKAQNLEQSGWNNQGSQQIGDDGNQGSSQGGPGWGK